MSENTSETKNQMAEALKKLIKDRSFSKITVQDIVAACNINRNTFYYHFENNYDLLYKNECQNWRNKINRVKNTAGFPADRLEKTQAAFADFKKEALQRKKAVKTGTASPKEFTDWLYQQSDIILKLTTF